MTDILSPFVKRFSVALLATSAMGFVAVAQDLPDISPEQIADDVERRYDDRTGETEYVAASFDPFETEDGLAGSAALRSAGDAITIDGEGITGGAFLDIAAVYTTDSPDSFDVKGFEQVNFMSGRPAGIVRYDTKTLDCSRSTDSVTYDDSYYRGASYGYVAGLYRIFPRYRGHRNFGWHRGSWNRGSLRHSNFRRAYRGRHGSANVRRDHRDRNDIRRSHEDRDQTRRGRNGDRDNTRRTRRDNADNDRVKRPRGANRGDFMRHREPQSETQNTRLRRGNDRTDRAQTRRSNTDQTNSRVRQRSEGDRTTRTPSSRRVNSDATQTRRDRVTNTPRTRQGRSADRQRVDRRAPDTQAVTNRRARTNRNNRTRADRPRRSDMRVTNTPQNTNATPTRQSAPTPRRAQRVTSSPQPRTTSRPKVTNRRAAPNTRKSPARVNRAVDKAFKSRNPRAKNQRQARYFPDSGYARTDVYVSYRCVKEETLSIHIPQEHLDAARFDGFAVMLVDNAGREVPVFVPPNYIEGFRQAVSYGPTGRTSSVTYRRGNPQPATPQTRTNEPIIYGDLGYPQ